MPVSVTLAKELVRQLSISDGENYYIKFVFTENNLKVVFISFHLDY